MDASKKNILFLINGLGLGNSTRCQAVIDELCEMGYQISIATSGNGLLYFKAQNYPIFEMRSFAYGNNKNKFSLIKTLLLIPTIVKNLISNYIQLFKILKATQYAAIVFDSDYTVSCLCFFQHPPLIALNNSQFVVNFLKNQQNNPRSIGGQYWIERLDSLFHNIIPDLVISPSLISYHSNTKKIRSVPVIVRNDFVPQARRGFAKKILVMLSGSQFKTNLVALTDPRLSSFQIQILSDKTDLQKNIQKIKYIYNNTALLKEADILVTNAGFSSISEAYILQKPLICLPIANHAEQYANAKIVEKIGFGTIANEYNIVDKLIEVSNNYERIKKSFLQQKPTNGAHLAAQIIHKAVTASSAKKAKALTWANLYQALLGLVKSKL